MPRTTYGPYPRSAKIDASTAQWLGEQERTRKITQAELIREALTYYRAAIEKHDAEAQCLGMHKRQAKWTANALHRVTPSDRDRNRTLARTNWELRWAK